VEVKLMAVRIRLKRMGSKRRPFYRFVVVDSRGRRDGGFLEEVGYYNPIDKPHTIKLEEERIFDWLGKGAQLSDGAKSLLNKTGTIARWRASLGKGPAPEVSGGPEVTETADVAGATRAGQQTQATEETGKPVAAAEDEGVEVTVDEAEEVPEEKDKAQDTPEA
jgi:small subunit ribosomal protein S16